MAYSGFLKKLSILELLTIGILDLAVFEKKLKKFLLLFALYGGRRRGLEWTKCQQTADLVRSVNKQLKKAAFCAYQKWSMFEKQLKSVTFALLLPLIDPENPENVCYFCGQKLAILPQKLASLPQNWPFLLCCYSKVVEFSNLETAKMLKNAC